MAKKTTRNQKQAEQAARKRRHIRIIAGIIMVAAAAGLAFGGLFWYQKEQKAQKAAPDSSDYADVLSSYYTAVLSADGQTLTQLMAPPEYWTYYMKTYSKSEDDVVKSFTEGCNNTVQEWKETYGDDVKVTYQIQGMSSQGDAGVSEWNTDMEKMLDYIDTLNELDTTGIEPMSHVFPVQNVFREDVVTNGDNKEKTLANAPLRKEDSFEVPKTIG